MADEERRVDREVVVDRDREPRGSNTALVVVLVVGVLLLLALLFGGFFDRNDTTPVDDGDTTEIEADVNFDNGDDGTDGTTDGGTDDGTTTEEDGGDFGVDDEDAQ